MDLDVGEVRLHYAEHGSGMPLVALHGAGVDHHDVEVALEDIVPRGLRRIYPDLPAMGRTTAAGLNSNDDVVTVLCAAIDRLAGGEAVLLLGHSYGAYLARAVATRRPDLVRGLALLCPVGESTGEVPAPSVARTDADAYADLDRGLREGFEGYFVVRTRANARRYRDHIAPATALVDQDALGRIFAGWPVTVGPFSKPALIVAARRDCVAGYADAAGLAESYPNSTFAVIDDAGHALMHEQPEVLRALVAEWVARAGVSTDATFGVHPIGYVESALTDPAAAPRQGRLGAPDAWLVIDPHVRTGIRDIAVGNELVVLTWLHLSRRDELSTVPGDDPTGPERGVFSTRSPARPNPIGLHEVTVRAVEHDRLLVGPLEAVDSTPVLDLKPVLRR